MKREPRSSTARRLASAGLVLLCVAEMAAAHAWSLNITSGSRRLFLHVGNGAVSGTSGTLNGTAGRNGPINTVSVAPTVAQMLGGAALVMSSDSTQNISLYGDGNNTCPTPTSQLMIGAGFRRDSGANSATLTVTSPINLTDLTTGEVIPITQISWTTSAPNGGIANIIPPGTFNGGTQTLTSVPGNRYIENCHTFSYANSP
jgi:hypothetical protein